MNQLFFKYFIKQKISFLFFIFITLFGVAISLNSQFENKNSTKQEISHYEQVIDVNNQDIEQIDEELKNSHILSFDKILLSITKEIDVLINSFSL